MNCLCISRSGLTYISKRLRWMRILNDVWREKKKRISCDPSWRWFIGSPSAWLVNILTHGHNTTLIYMICAVLLFFLCQPSFLNKSSKTRIMLAKDLLQSIYIQFGLIRSFFFSPIYQQTDAAALVFMGRSLDFITLTAALKMGWWTINEAKQE